MKNELRTLYGIFMAAAFLLMMLMQNTGREIPLLLHILFWSGVYFGVLVVVGGVLGMHSGEDDGIKKTEIER